MELIENVKKWVRRVECGSSRALYLTLRWLGPDETRYMEVGIMLGWPMNKTLVAARGSGMTWVPGLRGRRLEGHEVGELAWQERR